MKFIKIKYKYIITKTFCALSCTLKKAKKTNYLRLRKFRQRASRFYSRIPASLFQF